MQADSGTASGSANAPLRKPEASSFELNMLDLRR
jgi:hypothetical protein